MIVKKEIIRPGVYWYVDEATSMPRSLDVTAEMVKHFHDAGNAMLADRLSIPVPFEHQASAMPLTVGERAAKNLKENSGWVSKYEIEKGDRLMGHLNIEDPDVASKLPRTIRYTSPWINSFTDGNGKRWDGVIAHVALTTRPRITEQQPFPSVAAAMSFASTQPRTSSMKASLGEKGVALSRAGLLTAEPSGAFKPAYPLAFSMLSGAKLAELPIPEKKPKPKEEGNGDEKPAAKPEGKENGKPEVPVKKEGETPTPEEPMLPGMGDDPMMQEEALVDADGDISVYDVICDLMASEGYDIPEGVCKDNFAEIMYSVFMDKIKSKGSTEKDTEMTPPPAVPPKTPPTNPIIQESPPMYMSLEQINAIADPEKKSMALSLHSLTQKTSNLERHAVEAAKAKRQARLDKLAKKLPQSARDQLIAQAANAKFALGDDGIVKDEYASTLDILEAGIRDIPTLLTDQAGVAVVDHPREYDGQMTEERRQDVLKEYRKNAGFQSVGV